MQRKFEFRTVHTIGELLGRLHGSVVQEQARKLVNGMHSAAHAKQLLASQHPAFWLPFVDDLFEQ